MDLLPDYMSKRLRTDSISLESRTRNLELNISSKRNGPRISYRIDGRFAVPGHLGDIWSATLSGVSGAPDNAETPDPRRAIKTVTVTLAP